MPIKVKCNHCNHYFNKSPSAVVKNNYCSYGCYTKEKWLQARVAKHCEHCGSGFLTRKQDVDRGKGKYCCRNCSSMGQRELDDLECKQCGCSFYVAPAYRVDGRPYCSRECLHKSNLKYPNTMKLRNKVWQRKWRDMLHDNYIRGAINLPAKDIPKELIELKRLNIKRKRKIKQMENS